MVCHHKFANSNNRQEEDVSIEFFPSLDFVNLLWKISKLPCDALSPDEIVCTETRQSSVTTTG